MLPSHRSMWLWLWLLGLTMSLYLELCLLSSYSPKFLSSSHSQWIKVLKNSCWNAQWFVGMSTVQWDSICRLPSVVNVWTGKPLCISATVLGWKRPLRVRLVARSSVWSGSSVQKLFVSIHHCVRRGPLRVGIVQVSLACVCVKALELVVVVFQSLLCLHQTFAPLLHRLSICKLNMFACWKPLSSDFRVLTFFKNHHF